MEKTEIIVNAILFVAGWVLKRPAIVEKFVNNLFKKK